MSASRESVQIAFGPVANEIRVPVGTFVPAEFDLKRCTDIAGACLLLVLTLPILILIYCALSVTGAAIFKQRRVGQGGRPFYCYKFRTMNPDAERVLQDYLDANPDAKTEWERNFKLVDDPRVTRLGRFLRRSSLDELPQLINILIGDMSLVGPRPIVPAERSLYDRRIVSYERCRPGLTGLWQVSGRNLVSYDQRVRLDVYYARKQSARLDLVILARTAMVVLTGHGAM